MSETIADKTAFILANTRLQAPPHTPELRLHLADEITPIWRLTEEALGALGVPPPFWAFAWAGGQALARWILDHPDTVAGRSVVDFATGSGLVGIAAARAGAASVLCADIDGFCAAAVALNARANGVAVDFTGADMLTGPPPRVDVVLAADIAYEAPLAARVRAWLLQAREAGAHVLIGDPGRSYFSAAGLTHLARYEVAVTRELEDQEIKRSDVWSMD